MRVKIEAIGPQKSSQYGDYFGIKTAEEGWVNLQGTRDERLKGQTIEIDFKATKSGKWAKLIGKTSAQTSEHNGKPGGLNQFVFADALEFYWDKVKPFELSDEGKASVLCTLLIATADGRVHYEIPPDMSEDMDDPFE